ncbi:PspC domain-containing protein [archaeon]|nr:MAG: PspC domain-containing protein [archaeon]
MPEKKLYRSQKDRIIAGVCGGIAEYFNISPWVVRVVWIIVVISSFGVGVVAYLLAWALIPAGPKRG